MKTYNTLFLCAAVGLLTLVGVYLFSIRETYFIPVDPGTLVAQAVVEHESTEVPLMLFIPSIGVAAQVSAVGVTDDGSVATPENLEEVGWYQFGAIPGAAGNAVMDGHLDDFNGDPLVFARLSELVPGDSIYVLNAAYEIAHFEVTGTDIYAYDATNTIAVFGPSDEAQLNLITCEGEWLSDVQKGYTERLVVFSKLVSE